MKKIEIKLKLTNVIKIIDVIIKSLNEMDNIKGLTEQDFKAFCNERNIRYFANNFIQYVNLSNLIEDKNEEIQINLNKYKKFFQKILNDFEENWNNYNSQYKNHIETKIKVFLNFVENKSPFESKNNIDFVNSCINYLNNILEFYKFSNIENMYEQFKYGDKNYIVFGKNGAGKTSLLKNIQSNFLNKNSFVLPANRSILCNTKNLYQNERTMKDINYIFSHEKAIDILTVKLFNKKVEQLEEAHKQHILLKANTIEEEFCEMFNSLQLDRKIMVENENIYLFDDDIDKYQLSSASDGEKSIVLILLATLLLPENAYLFIDEPENHLNGALMVELFDKIEKARGDIKFIYLTHNIDFIESRDNCEIVYLNKTKKYNSWEFENLKTLQDLDVDILLNITGTKKPIIFCEGNNATSIDYKIFSNIYCDYLIVPCSSCEKVIENTKAFASNSFEVRRNVCGIIDNDFKMDNEINELKTNKIYVLEYNEIENILLDEDVLNLIDKFNQNNNRVLEIKKYVLNYVKENNENIMNDYVSKIYRKIIKTNPIKYNIDLENVIDKTNKENKENLIKNIRGFSENINTLIKNENYAELIKIIPGKYVVKKVANLLGFYDMNSYLNFFINKINNNDELYNLVSERLPKVRS